MIATRLVLALFACKPTPHIPATTRTTMVLGMSAADSAPDMDVFQELMDQQYKRFMVELNALEEEMIQGLNALKEERVQGFNALEEEMIQGLNGLKEERVQGLNALKEERVQGFNASEKELNALKEERVQELNALKEEMVPGLNALKGDIAVLRRQVNHLSVGEYQYLPGLMNHIVDTFRNAHNLKDFDAQKLKDIDFLNLVLKNEDVMLGNDEEFSFKKEEFQAIFTALHGLVEKQDVMAHLDFAVFEEDFVQYIYDQVDPPVGSQAQVKHFIESSQELFKNSKD